MNQKKAHVLTSALVASALMLGSSMLSSCAVARPTGLEQQRAEFRAAKQALSQENLDEFQKISAGLRNYPLYPYLQYEFLRSRIDVAEPTSIKWFLARYDDTPLARRLRHVWLYSLARRNQWWQYLAAYDGSSDVRLRCHYANAKLQTGVTKGLWQMVRELWLVGKSQPDACDPVFEAWRKSGGMTQKDVLRRVELAMQRGNMRLVSYLDGFLPDAQRQWVMTWRKMRAQPETELDRLRPDTQHPEWSARLFAYGVRRLARYDALLADSIWTSRHTGFALNPDQIVHTKRAIALNLAFDRDPSATRRLAALSKDVRDPTVRAWRVRAALWQRNWTEVLAALDDLTEKEKHEEKWIYWRARALEALGRTKESDALVASAAHCRCFYGFIAAERAGMDPAIDNEPLVVKQESLARMASLPAMVRAKELLALNLDQDARREWWEVTRKMDQGQLKVAAKLADRWGWHDQAIITLGRTGSLDDLELRFPTPYEPQVMHAAARRELDTAFVYALMRQESAFNARARSHVGALGLMQLMPATARRTARQISRPLPHPDDLLTATKNIQLGTAHLRQLLDRFDGNLLYTIAAYNAGGHRVTQWRPKDAAVPADIWIESMPFRETRNYVKHILAYTRIYQWRLGREPTPMSEHLGALAPATPDAVAGSDIDNEQPTS